MNPKIDQLAPLQNKQFNPVINSKGTHPYVAINSSRYGHRIDAQGLYLIYFNEIPNSIEITFINTFELYEWINDKYKHCIKDVFYEGDGFYRKEEIFYLHIYYIIGEDILLHLNLMHNDLLILYRNTEIYVIKDLINNIKKFKVRKSKTPQISILVYRNNGIETEIMSLSKPKLRVDENYNDDFITIHKVILKRLTQKKNKGLVLLYGRPGTGKTSYIHYLISKLKKEVILLPPDMAQVITRPDFITILTKNPNSVFVIEDAENIVLDRNQGNGSAVSALLNVSDGLISECLNIQIICTFNTDISKVDSALLRKGRLIAKYEFKKLKAEKAQRLSDRLGFDTIITHDMSLAEIYNQEDRDFSKDNNCRRGIGFTIADNN